MRFNEKLVQEIVFEALSNLNSERDIAHQIPLEMDTVLFGRSSLLDSLSLVSVIADVEMAVSDKLGMSISLTDDQALSQTQSPYSSVKSLCAYVLLVADEKG